jgi:peptidoglycan/LPS O-acetylase OafA/YrhL
MSRPVACVQRTTRDPSTAPLVCFVLACVPTGAAAHNVDAIRALVLAAVIWPVVVGLCTLAAGPGRRWVCFLASWVLYPVMVYLALGSAEKFLRERPYTPALLAVTLIWGLVVFELRRSARSRNRPRHAKRIKPSQC